MKFIIPAAIKAEHEELHHELNLATQVSGKIGEAAQEVAKVLTPHFAKEEEFALPPLGILLSISGGKVDPEMAAVLPLTDRLKAELPEMLAEHQKLATALKRLSGAAKVEQKLEFTHFAAKLVLHAQTEEQVLYPAAILIGEYLKLKLGK